MEAMSVVRSGVHQAALNRAAGLGQLGGDDAIDIARDRHQRHDRLASGRSAARPRKELEVVDRRAGALRHTGHRGRLRE